MTEPDTVPPIDFAEVGRALGSIRDEIATGLPALIASATATRCWCRRPANGACGCCCTNHDAVPVNRRTDGGPSVREFRASKGEV